jgi:hypothetical protein
MNKVFKILFFAFFVFVLAIPAKSLALEAAAQADGMASSSTPPEETPQAPTPTIVKVGKAVTTVWGLKGLAQAIIGGDMGAVCGNIKFGESKLEKFLEQNCEMLLDCLLNTLKDNASLNFLPKGSDKCIIKDCYQTLRNAVKAKNISTPNNIKSTVTEAIQGCKAMCSMAPANSGAQKACGVTDCVLVAIALSKNPKDCTQLCKKDPTTYKDRTSTTGSTTEVTAACEDCQNDIFPSTCCSVVTGKFEGRVGAYIKSKCTSVFDTQACILDFDAKKRMQGECCANFDKIHNSGTVSDENLKLMETYCANSVAITQCSAEVEKFPNIPDDIREGCCKLITLAGINPDLEKFIPSKITKPYNAYDAKCSGNLSVVITPRTDCAGSTNASNMTSACCAAYYAVPPLYTVNPLGPSYRDITNFCNNVLDLGDLCLLIANNPTVGVCTTGGSLNPVCNSPTYCSTGNYGTTSPFCNAGARDTQKTECCAKLADLKTAKPGTNYSALEAICTTTPVEVYDPTCFIGTSSSVVPRMQVVSSLNPNETCYQDNAQTPPYVRCVQFGSPPPIEVGQLVSTVVDMCRANLKCTNGPTDLAKIICKVDSNNNWVQLDVNSNIIGPITIKDNRGIVSCQASCNNGTAGARIEKCDWIDPNKKEVCPR